jgi:hypothetical protein
MRLRLPAVLAGTLLAGLAVASLSAAGGSAPGRAGRLRLDRPLIEAVVDSGLRLAAEDDPLKRAEACSALAGHLAEEARRSAAAREPERAADLGQCLQSLLVRGVAANLSRARGEMPEGSPRLLEMRRLGEQAAALAGPVMEDLERSAGPQAPDMRAAAEALNRARAVVEKAGKGKAHPGDRKGPGA